MPPVSSKPLCLYVGIDPGASGGLACVGLVHASAEPMPRTEDDLLDWFRQLPSGDGINVYAVIEKVGGYIKGSEFPGSAMFNFGDGYGQLKMACAAEGLIRELVTPGVWQKGLGIPGRKKDEAKTPWKNRLKAVAQRLFPEVKVTLATADALLIAEYCRRKRTGTL